MNKYLKYIAIILIWAICGLHNWGFSMAMFNDIDGTPRNHYGICSFLAMTGPIGVLPILFSSNIYENGFLLK